MIPRTCRVVAIVSCLLALGAGRAEGQQTEELEYHVDGIAGPAEILVDRWGVPHILATTHYDAFFVQGFNAARDRLWQLDTWRRRGLGQMAEVFGPSYVDQDRAARLFLYRGDMYSEWLAYGSDAKRIATAFTDGINSLHRTDAAEPEPRAVGVSVSGLRARDVEPGGHSAHPESWSRAQRFE